MVNPIKQSIKESLYRNAGRTLREADYDTGRGDVVQAGPGPRSQPAGDTGPEGPQTAAEPDPETGDAIAEMEKHLAGITKLIAEMDEFRLSDSQVTRLRNVGENMRAVSQDIDYALESIGKGTGGDLKPHPLEPEPSPEDFGPEPDADLPPGPSPRPTPPAAGEDETLGVGFP